MAAPYDPNQPPKPEANQAGFVTGLAGTAGGAIGGVIGGPAGAMIGKEIGQTVGQGVSTIASEFSGAARAQRQMFKDAKRRMRTHDQGFDQAVLSKMNASGQQQVAAQQAAQQAEIARAQAGGQLAGGAATEAQRAVAQQAAGGVAQVASQNQALSDAFAQRQYANDQAIINAQADRTRAFWRGQSQKGNAGDSHILGWAGGAPGLDIDTALAAGKA